MSGSSPHAGTPGVTGVGQASANRELAVDQTDAPRWVVASIISQTESYLPGGFAVGSELLTGANGPLVTVATHPPVGHSISAGFLPGADDFDAGLTNGGRDEVARGFAANAAFQAMNAIGGDLTPATR